MDIVTAKNPILAQKAAPVKPADITSARIKKIIERMKKALAKEPLGVAIAAPQIGESLRIFVVSGKALARTAKAAKTEDRDDRVYINPEILKVSRKKNEMHEGCLSVRGSAPDMMVWGTVLRADKMKIRATDETGKEQEHSATGFLAQIFQHEIDHLEGILYTQKAVKVYEEKLPPAK